MRRALKFLCCGVLLAIFAVCLIGAIATHGLPFVVFIVVLVAAVWGAAAL